MEHQRLLELANEETPAGERLQVSGLFIANTEAMQIWGKQTAYICESARADEGTYWYVLPYGCSIPGSKLYESANEARRVLIEELKQKRERIDSAIAIAESQLRASERSNA